MKRLGQEGAKEAGCEGAEAAKQQPAAASTLLGTISLGSWGQRSWSRRQAQHQDPQRTASRMSAATHQTRGAVELMTFNGSVHAVHTSRELQAEHSGSRSVHVFLRQSPPSTTYRAGSLHHVQTSLGAGPEQLAQSGLRSEHVEARHCRGAMRMGGPGGRQALVSCDQVPGGPPWQS